MSEIAIFKVSRPLVARNEFLMVKLVIQVFLKTNNKFGERVGYFGSGKSQDGLATLYDRYGDLGWSEDGR